MSANPVRLMGGCGETAREVHLASNLIFALHQPCVDDDSLSVKQVVLWRCLRQIRLSRSAMAVWQPRQAVSNLFGFKSAKRDF